MVMATGSLCQQHATIEPQHEAARELAGGAADEAASDPAALHERLVAYVHALAPSHEAHSGVWVEHSYARARAAAAARVRALLAPPPPAPAPALLDVLGAPLATPAPIAHPVPPLGDDDDDDDGDEWEQRVRALAPGAVHAQLAECALDALRALRLARLAGGHEPERAAARRLRLALAAALARGPALRAGSWLHDALTTHAPRSTRRLYDEVVAELHRAAPRLAERALGVSAPAPRRSPLERTGAPVGPESSPWLLWLSGGSARQDRRWRRRLGALVHTRVLAAPPPGPAPTDAWCASVAGAVRAALADALAEAGERAVVVGGCGAGAALCAALAGAAGAGDARVRGLLLLAPALRSAEGARPALDDSLAELRLPLLLVAGTRAAQSWRGALRRAAAAAEARHVLEVCGADDALRLPAHARRALRLSQHALDAAVADECARWALHAAEGEGEEARAAPRRRPGAPDARDPDEYAHLPVAGARHDRAAEAPGDGRVVSRGSGATPLALLPPRRPAAPSAAPAATPGPALAAADIMRLPIVFADDEAVEADAAPSAVTVTSGGAARRGGSFARVIVASRGGGGAAAGRGGRPLLLRRTVRLVPRQRAQP